ncbi:hypothetical protein Tco_0835125 [Tanacetum coccineum]
MRSSSIPHRADEVTIIQFPESKVGVNTRTGTFSFAKRSLSLFLFSRSPPILLRNGDHFFWVDSRVFPIFVPLYTGGVLEKDPAPHLTARQEQAVQQGNVLLKSTSSLVLSWINRPSVRCRQRSDPLPAKRLRIDHPSLASGTGGKSLAICALLKGYSYMGHTSSAMPYPMILPCAEVPDALWINPRVTTAAGHCFLCFIICDKILFVQEVSALKNAVSQKDIDISLLDSCASYLKSALDDSQSACDEARHLISSLSSERDGLASERSIEAHRWKPSSGVCTIVVGDLRHTVMDFPKADFHWFSLVEVQRKIPDDEVLDGFFTWETGPLASLPDAGSSSTEP